MTNRTCFACGRHFFHADECPAMDAPLRCEADVPGASAACPNAAQTIWAGENVCHECFDVLCESPYGDEWPVDPASGECTSAAERS